MKKVPGSPICAAARGSCERSGRSFCSAERHVKVASTTGTPVLRHDGRGAGDVGPRPTGDQGVFRRSRGERDTQQLCHQTRRCLRSPGKGSLGLLPLEGLRSVSSVCFASTSRPIISFGRERGTSSCSSSLVAPLAREERPGVYRSIDCPGRPTVDVSMRRPCGARAALREEL